VIKVLPLSDFWNAIPNKQGGSRDPCR
jgi:hypothetical protein